MKKADKKLLLGILILPIVLFLLVSYIGNVLDIGEKLGRLTSIYVEVIFDILLLLIPFSLPLWMLINYLKYEVVCFDEILDDKFNDAEENDQKLASKRIEKLAVSILEANESIRKSSHEYLEKAIDASGYDNKKIYFRDYINECRKEADREGQYLTILAALSVVVSPQRVGDTIGMLFWNYRIVNKILSVYGVRPPVWALVKLYCYVLASSILVGSIEDVLERIDIKIPFLNPICQASAAIYSCLKTISLTQYYLEHGINATNRKEAIEKARDYAKANYTKVFDNNKFKENSSRVVDDGFNYLNNTLKQSMQGILDKIQIGLKLKVNSEEK